MQSTVCAIEHKLAYSSRKFPRPGRTSVSASPIHQYSIGCSRKRSLDGNEQRRSGYVERLTWTVNLHN